jgi:hypothetical protein
MAWYPVYGVGIVVLTNSADHAAAHVQLADRIISAMDARGLLTRTFPVTSLPVCGIAIGSETDDSRYFKDHPEEAAWKAEWSRYLGRYRLSLYAEPAWYARLAMSLGVPRQTFIKITRQGNGIALDGVSMLEHEPGLFFTKDGEAMDVRTDPPLWRNIRVTRR